MSQTLSPTNKVITNNEQIHELISKRWSPRSFSSKEISKEDLLTILEAAGQAFSANNLQPWHYVYAFRGTKGFDALWQVLAPGNQPWAKDAAVLMISLAQVQNDNGQANHWSQHDLGAANATLALQAFSMDIYSHLMAGFDQDKALAVTALDASIWQPVAMIALGYLGTAEQLQEPYFSRELAVRSRKTVDSISTLI
jgi:nitroreductase